MRRRNTTFMSCQKQMINQTLTESKNLIFKLKKIKMKNKMKSILKKVKKKRSLHQRKVSRKNPLNQKKKLKINRMKNKKNQLKNINQRNQKKKNWNQNHQKKHQSRIINNPHLKVCQKMNHLLKVLRKQMFQSKKQKRFLPRNQKLLKIRIFGLKKNLRKHKKGILSSLIQMKTRKTFRNTKLSKTRSHYSWIQMVLKIVKFK